MQTPAYNCFFSCINNSKCHLVENKLVRTDDSYVIDWDDFEAKAALPTLRFSCSATLITPLAVSGLLMSSAAWATFASVMA